MITNEQKVLQDALDYACARGRFEGGWDARNRMSPFQRISPPPAKPSGDIHLNGEGMAGVKRDAVLLSLRRNNFRKADTARDLKISRSALHSMLKQIAVTACLLCVILTTAIAATPPFPPVPLNVFSSPLAITNITLAWEVSADTNVAGYRIYWGPAAWMFTNSIAVGKVTNTTINLRSNANYYFAATAYDSTGLESPFSNLAFGTTWPAPVQSLTVYSYLYSVNLIPGVTNLILSSTNATGPWATNVTVLGTTNLFTMLVTNTGPKKFYKVKTQ